MGVAQKSSGAPLPAKLAGLLREAKWLVLIALAAYLLLILATYRRSDPGWSHSATGASIGNAGGVVGAWLMGQREGHEVQSAGDQKKCSHHDRPVKIRR